MPWWSWFDRADAWVDTPEVQMVKGLFCLSVVIGFSVAWLWQRLR